MHVDVVTVRRSGTADAMGGHEQWRAARPRPPGHRQGYPAAVSAERDELKRLVEELSDDRVLAEARRQAQPRSAVEWPPPWFASFASGRTDLGSNHDDLLADGFGRS